MSYQDIVKHYEKCLDKHGDNHLGVDWPIKEDALKRYKVMLDLIQESENNVSLLDFGCGAAHLYEYIMKENLSKIDYYGWDISEKFVSLCKSKHPKVNFACGDILLNDALLPLVDYIILNGVFTEKRNMSHSVMSDYFQSMLVRIFHKANKGIAFNVMSKYVDWERSDLFHLSFDEMAKFVSNNLSRNFIIRSDYGLYEYTVYVYRNTINIGK